MSAPQDGPVHESAPEWPDAGSTPPVGHVCPPDQAAMFARLQEIESSYTTRLANQRQVIENLSDARHQLLAANARYETFVRYVADDFTGDYALSVKAQELLNAQEEGN